MELPTGFQDEPRLSSSGSVYRGRFTCPSVQWTGDADDRFATFTITAGEIADAAASNILWTDQDVQRGIQPAALPRPPRELSLATGYPEPSKYIFDGSKADEIAEKLLRDDQLFLNPLIWNLRPGHFSAFWDKEAKDIYVYAGKIYLPDSHHRHQAIIKAVNAWRESQSDYPAFTQEKQFKVELYFLSREDEGNYFYDKNQLPKPTSKSKAFDLTTSDDLSLLAKAVIEQSDALRENVNRVTDRLDSRNAQVITLSTLREMMRTFVSAETVDASELEGLARVAAQFYDMLANVRPELGRLDVASRRTTRISSLVDAGVMMHGYAALMRDYNLDLAKMGSSRAKTVWQERLARLRADQIYRYDHWVGDFFDKQNPLWSEVGLIRPATAARKLTTLNTGAARGEAGRVLRQLIGVDPVPHSLKFLAQR